MAQTSQSGGRLAGQLGATVGFSPGHPEMRRRRNRSYGSNDYERFDHLVKSQASLGSAKVGKVGVDCRYLFTKSKWGVMGKHRTPAGIVYLDLEFHEPKGCRLHSAIVTVTLDENHGELSRIRRQQGINIRSMPPITPVQMTDYYGPKCFVGPETSAEKKKTIQFQPSIEAAGFGGSLVNVCRESTYTSSSRWKFSTRLIPGNERNWNYEAIQWELSENVLERDVAHNNVFHTAFAFEHGRRPFFLRLDVDGHFRGMRGVIRKTLSRFRASTKLDDSTAVTLINFGEQHVFPNSLDFKAKNLDFEMEQANILSIPMVVSNPQPVTYETSETTGPSPNHGLKDRSRSENRPDVSTLGDKLHELLIDSGIHPPQAIREEQSMIPPDLEDLAKIINTSFLVPVNKHESHITRQQIGRTHNPGTATTVQEFHDKTQVNGSIRNHVQSKALEDPGLVQSKATIPGLMFWVQLLVILRNWLNRLLIEVDQTQEMAANHGEA